MGDVEVPEDALWGASTQRAVENFKISGQRLGRPFIQALGYIKTAAVKANLELWRIDDARAEAIEAAANEVASGNLFPVKNCLIHYPDCGTLFLADFIGGTLMAPLVMVAGPIIAYNALIFADLLFSCWAMFWLIRRLTGDPLAAFVAGTIYGLSALNLGHMSNGVTETLQTGWLPLFLGALYALFDDAREPGHRKRTARLIVLAAAALWAVTVGGHWYQGVYASGLFVLLVAVHCFGPHRWRLLARSGALFGAFAVMILPVVLVFLSLLQSELSLTRGIVALSSPDMQNSADPGNFFSATAPIQKDSQFFLHLTYLGLSVPLLAMAWGLTIRDLTAHGAPALWLNNRRWLRALLVVGLLAGTVALHLRCLRFYSLYRNLNPAFQFRDATRWMARNLQPGAVVVNLDWDDFPELYYDGHRQRYIWGLDPTYSLRQDRALSLQLEAYARGRAPVDPGLLRRRLGADFMIMRRNRGGGRPGLARGRIPVVYSDRWAMVFDLRPQGLRRPED